MGSLLWARRDATEGWAKSQSYNLYRKIKIFHPQITQIICVICAISGLLCRYFRNAAGIFLELAGVIETGKVFV